MDGSIFYVAYVIRKLICVSNNDKNETQKTRG